MQSTKIEPEVTSPGVGTAYITYCRRRLLEEYLPRITRCLEELTDDDIWWRAHDTDNSVGNLILHLNGNVRQWIISGIGGVSNTRDRAKEFAERGPIPKGELLKKFEATIREADRALEQFDQKNLLEMRHIQRDDITCLDAISHVVEHFAQHLGQIIYVTKLRKAIDLKFYDL
ncbi:MAG: DUF1572 family protein [Ignavibacteria bacterium]|nr:DUF1572 family protein [Ignavibacteria bacterium]MBI3766185.1 DUF1572 family protein [Ignavibacteriales bacterium]